MTALTNGIDHHDPSILDGPLNEYRFPIDPPTTTEGSIVFCEEHGRALDKPLFVVRLRIELIFSRFSFSEGTSCSSSIPTVPTAPKKSHIIPLSLSSSFPRNFLDLVDIFIKFAYKFTRQCPVFARRLAFPSPSSSVLLQQPIHRIFYDRPTDRASRPSQLPPIYLVPRTVTNRKRTRLQSFNRYRRLATVSRPLALAGKMVWYGTRQRGNLIDLIEQEIESIFMDSAIFSCSPLLWRTVLCTSSLPWMALVVSTSQSLCH